MNEAQGRLDLLEELVEKLKSNNSISTTRGAKKYFPSVLGLIKLRRVEFRTLAGHEFTAADRSEISEAIKYFEEAVVHLPEHSPLLTMLGETYLQQGRLDEAKSVLTKAAKVDPTSPMPLGALAMLNIQLGNANEAFKLIKKATKVAPASQIAWDNLAHMYKLTGG